MSGGKKEMGLNVPNAGLFRASSFLFLCRYAAQLPGLLANLLSILIHLVFSGGLVSDLQRLLPLDSGNDLYLYKFPEVPAPLLFYVRPFQVRFIAISQLALEKASCLPKRQQVRVTWVVSFASVTK